MMSLGVAVGILPIRRPSSEERGECPTPAEASPPPNALVIDTLCHHIDSHMHYIAFACRIYIDTYLVRLCIILILYYYSLLVIGVLAEERKLQK